MGKRLQHRVFAIALLLLVLLPLPPAVLSAPTLPSLAIKTFTTEMVVLIKGIGKDFKQYLLAEVAKNVVSKIGEVIDAGINTVRYRGRHRHHEEETEKSADSAAGLFIVNLTVGTPWPQTISGVLDINSQLVWTQCAPCTSEHDCQVGPTSQLFNPNRSGTFATLPCWSDICKRSVPGETCGGGGGGSGIRDRNRSSDDDHCQYKAGYGNGTFTIGRLANETFMFGTTRVDNIVFGCSATAVGDFSGAAGVFGFNRGALSLVTQLRLSWFSYLWSPNESQSQFQFGGDRAPQPQNTSSSTHLLTSSGYPDMYFVRLTGIRVDGVDLGGAIPAGTFDFQPNNGSGGVLLSTTVPVTFLDEDAYWVVKGAITAKITAARPVDGSAVGLDLCYKAEALRNVTVPKLALVFDGGAVMNLSRYNYFYNDNDSGLDCLSVLPSVGGSVLGSLAQKGTNMTYDIARQQLIFVQQQKGAPSASLAHSVESLVMMMPYYFAVWVMLF